MKWFLIPAFLMICGFSVSSIAKVNGVRQVASAEEKLTDVVLKIRSDDEGLVVLFSKSKSSYYLRRESPAFEGQKQKLEKSLNEKKPVSVTFDTTLLNILDVK